MPEGYVGKQIEVLIYATDELQEQKTIARKKAKLRGALNLTDEQYKDFQQFAHHVRSEWDKAI